jgi:hypothetical protein
MLWETRGGGEAEMARGESLKMLLPFTPRYLGGGGEVVNAMCRVPLRAACWCGRRARARETIEALDTDEMDCDEAPSLVMPLKQA